MQALPRLDSCCFCIPLRIGNLLLGSIGLIASIAAFSLNFLCAIRGRGVIQYKFQDLKNHLTLINASEVRFLTLEDAEKEIYQHRIICGIAALVSAFLCLYCIVLLLGILLKKPELIHLTALSCLILFVAIAFCIAGVIDKALGLNTNLEFTTILIMYVVAASTVYLIMLYFVIVMNSYSSDMYEDRYDAYLDEERVMKDKETWKVGV